MASSDFADRLAALEARLDGLSVDDLPLKQIQDKLEQDWQPNAQVMLGAKSITAPMLAATLADLGLKLAHGVANVTWPGASATSSVLVVAHGLGAVPHGWVTAQTQTSVGATAAYLNSVDATDLSIQLATTGGFTPPAGTQTPVAWLAIL